jgi:hypothetical protein
VGQRSHAHGIRDESSIIPRQPIVYPTTSGRAADVSSARGGTLKSSMARVGPLLSVLLFVSAACGASRSTPATPSSHDSAWSELRLSWDFGPCPDDGRSCHEMLTVKPDGGFIASETPNPKGGGGDGEPSRRFASLDAQETRELHRIVDAPGFLDQLGSFGCPPDPDATVQIEVDLPSGTRREQVGGCVHSSDAQPSPPRALVALLEPHRLASHDTPPAHPLPPTGEGDPCTTGVGCGPGLVCVVAPCVVAPCTSGSCQKSAP